MRLAISENKPIAGMEEMKDTVLTIYCEGNEEF